VLSRKKLRWYLFGAQAVNLYGRPRMTADVDVTVEVPAAERPGLLRSLARAGFVARVENIEAFAERTRVLPFVHRGTGFPLDLVIAADGLEAAFLARAQMIDVGGVRLPVISVEDLVVAKVIAGRAKDLDDVRGIVAAHSALDRSAVARLLTELDELLERADLLPAFERLLQPMSTT